MQKYKSNITSTTGAAIRNVPITVLNEDGSLALLYLDRAGTVPVSNPLTTDTSGTFYFYAVNGRYSLKTTVDGVTITDNDVVLLYDPADASKDSSDNSYDFDLIPKLRQVASRCCYPDTIVTSLKQIWSSSIHRAGDNISWLCVGFVNYYFASETANTNNLLIQTVIEYPIGSGDWTFITYNNGNMTGVVLPGGEILSDPVMLHKVIPAGSWFKIWHYHASEGGIPCTYGGTGGLYPEGSMSEFFGGNDNFIPTVNPLMIKDKFFFDGLTNNSDNVISINPMCILTHTNVRSFGILGDARTSNMYDLNGFPMDAPSDDTYTTGIVERTAAREIPFINMSCGYMTIRMVTGEGASSKRQTFLRYVTDVFQSFGSDDFKGWTDENLLQQDQIFAKFRFIEGKPLYTATVPPQTVSTDNFTSLINQTLDTDDRRRKVLNDFRRTSSIYTGCIDLEAIVCTQEDGKWDVYPESRQIVVSTSNGSPVVTSAGQFLPADNGRFFVVKDGLGSSDFIGKAEYIDKNSIRIIHPYKNTPINAGANTNNVTGYASAMRYTWDGIHENQNACEKYRDAF